MTSFNILIDNKIIKETVKPAVQVQNIIRSQYVTIRGKLCFVTYKTQLINSLNLLTKVSIGQSTQYRTC